jgi:hypothetical protein
VRSEEQVEEDIKLEGLKKRKRMIEIKYETDILEESEIDISTEKNGLCSEC